MSEGASNERRLRRALGIWLASAVTVNAMVGTGIFRLAPTVLDLAGSASRALLAWAVGGVISLCGALCIGELSAAMPRAGGIYEYLRRAYGPSVGFWFGWTRLWLLGPSAAGSFARLAAESTGALLGLAPSSARDTALAMVLLAGCTAVNLTQVRTASRGQAVIAAAKLLGLCALGIVCLTLTPDVAPTDAPAASGAAPSLRALGALVSVMWALDGWADVSSLAAEAREPQRVLPPALLIGTTVVTVAYLITNLGYLRVLGEGGVLAASAGREMVAVRAAGAVLGEVGVRAMAALVLTSSIGACLVGMLTGSRVFVSMASDRLFPAWPAHVSERTGAPARAVLMSSGLAMVYLSVHSFEQLTDAFVVGMFPFYVLSVIAVAVLRRREPALPRPFRAPLYPLLALIFLGGATAVLAGGLSDVGGTGLGALAVMLLGLPCGALYVRRRRSA